jgi:hypothetical protein
MTVSRETYISRTLALVNWHTQPDDSAERYPEVDLPSLSGAIDRVLLSSEPYHLPRDGEMTSWYGSRAIHGLRYLAAYAHGAGPG